MINILDERKIAILLEIVESFIVTSEPVGSKFLSQKSSIGVSSATIRNEMRLLEEQGFLTKAHRSSGRIPSDKAYRQYVNLCIHTRDYPYNDDILSELKDKFRYKDKDMSNILEFSSILLADKTKYTTVIISSASKISSFKHLELSTIDSGKILVVFIDQEDNALSTVINYGGFGSEDDLRIYTHMVRKDFLFKTLEELVVSKAGVSEDYPHRDMTINLYNLAIEYLEANRDRKVYSSGLSHLMNFWDEDLDYMRDLISFLEKRENLLKVMSFNDDDIAIKIGVENQDKMLKDASIISAKYDINDDLKGTVNIIGPTRMDYRYLVKMSLSMSSTIERIESLIKR